METITIITPTPRIIRLNAKPPSVTATDKARARGQRLGRGINSSSVTCRTFLTRFLLWRTGVSSDTVSGTASCGSSVAACSVPLSVCCGSSAATTSSTSFCSCEFPGSIIVLSYPGSEASNNGDALTFDFSRAPTRDAPTFSDGRPSSSQQYQDSSYRRMGDDYVQPGSSRNC